MQRRTIATPLRQSMSAPLPAVLANAFGVVRTPDAQDGESAAPPGIAAVVRGLLVTCAMERQRGRRRGPLLHRPGQAAVAAKAPREPLARSAATGCQQAADGSDVRILPAVYPRSGRGCFRPEGAADAGPQRQPVCRSSSHARRTRGVAAFTNIQPSEPASGHELRLPLQAGRSKKRQPARRGCKGDKREVSSGGPKGAGWVRYTGRCRTVPVRCA